MSQRPLPEPKQRVQIYLPRGLYNYFEAFLLSATEGRKKHGFSAIIERLLEQERSRLIDLHAEALKAPPTGDQT